jgi:hypothetical protein
MDTLPAIIGAVQSYCEQSGKDPQSVCRAVTNNPRLWDRLNKRAAQDAKLGRRVAEFIAANPPKGAA